jgi:hypothetical protein
VQLPQIAKDNGDLCDTPMTAQNDPFTSGTARCPDTLIPNETARVHVRDNAAHLGLSTVMGASGRMNIRACMGDAMRAHAAGSSCAAIISTRR